MPPPIDIELKEIWNYDTARKGDHIRVSRGLYCHHGIYVSDDEIIHFIGTEDDNILDWSKNSVIQSNLAKFLRDGRLEVKEYTQDELDDLYDVEHIIHYARNCIGDMGYNLAFNNCEHFANICTLGRFRSRQVENVTKLIISGGIDVGFFSRVGDAWNALWGKGGSSSGGNRRSESTTTTNATTNNNSTTTINTNSNTVTTTNTNLTTISKTYNYEPDKVKITEIEADTKIRLAGKEIERIEMMKNARLDILEFELKSNLALEEAKARGLHYMAQTIINMQEKLNDVAEKRLAIIERGSLQIIKEIEGFYEELGNRINVENDKYSTEKLPQLLSLLEKYEIGTPSHNIYMKRIDDDMSLQMKLYDLQIESIITRQSNIISGFLQSKDRIVEQTGQLTAGMLGNIEKNLEHLQLTENVSDEQMLLDRDNNKLIGYKK